MRACPVGVLAFTLLLAACGRPTEPVAIDSLPGEAQNLVAQPREPASPPFGVKPHPRMAAQGGNSMHADSYNSDVHATAGPLGRDTRIVSRRGSRLPGGQCANFAFDGDGHLLALCADIAGFNLQLLEPGTLRLLADYSLPVRSSTWRALLHRDRRHIMEDSSGAYFYLDEQDRIVLADNLQAILRIAHRRLAGGGWELYADAEWGLGVVVPGDCLRPTNPFPAGECDQITAVMPDHAGPIWWVTRAGRLGTLDPASARIAATDLGGEEIQNGIAVDEQGMYLVSDHALYAFRLSANGMPELRWREAYDRGSARKLGAINQGSGTTPTLIGDRWITVTDNADGRINLLVLRRDDEPGRERLLCKVPVFDHGHSVSENSMIAIGRSILLENNAGYTSAHEANDWANVGGGIVRVDLREDESGCDVVWTSPERIPSVVPKLAAASGVAYFYTFEPLPGGNNAWFLIGLDFTSGRTITRMHTGNGPGYDNNWAPIALAADGTAYVGTSMGLLAIRDARAGD